MCTFVSNIEIPDLVVRLICFNLHLHLSFVVLQFTSSMSSTSSGLPRNPKTSCSSTLSRTSSAKSSLIDSSRKRCSSNWTWNRNSHWCCDEDCNWNLIFHCCLKQSRMKMKTLLFHHLVWWVLVWTLRGLKPSRSWTVSVFIVSVYCRMNLK